MISLDKITTNGKGFYLAYDQGMEHGPTDFDDENVNPETILKLAVKLGCNGIILQKGIAEDYYVNTDYKNKIPLILKLNGKTNLVTQIEPYSPKLCSVKEALELGASAVGYTVYLGSEHEAKMLSEFAVIEKEAEQNGLPVIVWMYPRGKAIEGKDIKELTAYGARVALEIGADMVKLNYPGDEESLRWTVEAAGKVKVVVAGGVKETEEEFLNLTRIVMKSGAIGMAVGRNIWQAKDPLEIGKKVKEIIFSQ